MARGAGGDIALLAWVGLALLGSLAVTLMLVHLALRPVRDLERTAARVWRGDLSARVPPSPFADRDMLRLRRTINLLLDRLIADRERTRTLTAQVIESGDRERARVARELHDSTAQTLSALALQAQSALTTPDDGERRERLEAVRALSVDALEEVRTLSQALHPRILDDLGLGMALRCLVRHLRQTEHVDAALELHGDPKRVPRPLASVLFHVAREAARNAVRHADTRTITVAFGTGPNLARVEVVDDGCGFDVDAARQRTDGIGLFAMAERLALVDGIFEIRSIRSGGTRVTATVPLSDGMQKEESDGRRPDSGHTG